MLRRLAGRPISVGGRDHSSHRLVSLGLNEQKVVSLLWGLAAAGGATGLLTSWMPIGVIGIAVLLVLATALFGIFLGSLPVYAIPESAPIRSRRTMIPTLRVGTNPVRVLRDAKVDMLVVPPNGCLAPADQEVIDACEVGGLRVARLELLMSPVRPTRDIRDRLHGESVPTPAAVLNGT